MSGKKSTGEWSGKFKIARCSFSSLRLSFSLSLEGPWKFRLHDKTRCRRGIRFVATHAKSLPDGYLISRLGYFEDLELKTQNLKVIPLSQHIAKKDRIKLRRVNVVSYLPLYA